MSFFDQLLFQHNVILDNPVVHDHHPPRAITVRMSVFFSGSAMRGPASMADAISAIQRLETNDLFQVAQLALGAPDLQAFAIPAHCNSR